MTTTMSDELLAALGESQIGPSLDEIFEGMIPRLQQRLEQQDAEWAHIQQMYAERRSQHESERARTLRILKDLGWEEKKQRAKRDGGEPKPSPEATTKTVRWLAEQSEPKSFREISEGTGIALSSATKQMNVARKLELVRVARHGGRTGRQQFFAINDDALQRLDEGSVQWP